MDMNNSRASSGTCGWESEGSRKLMVKEISHTIMMTSAHNGLYDISNVKAWVERVENELYASSKDREDFIAKITAWMLSIGISSQIPGLKSWATPFNERANVRVANIDWQKFPYDRVQTLKSMYLSKFAEWCSIADNILEQLESAPKHVNQRTVHIFKCNFLMGMLEIILQHLNVSNGQISPDFKKTLDEVEQDMNLIMRPTNASQDHDEVFHQENLSELPLVMSQPSSYLSEQIPDYHQNKVSHKR